MREEGEDQRSEPSEGRAQEREEDDVDDLRLFLDRRRRFSRIRPVASYPANVTTPVVIIPNGHGFDL
jgi:hypothetical protein